MTLLNAPAFNEKKERRNKTLLIASGVLIVLLILLTLAGRLTSHGWLFSDMPAEWRVDRFFAALQAKDYNKAFAIYTNDSQWQDHPDKFKDYPEPRFQEDWTTQDPIDGPLLGYHVDFSNTDGDGFFGSGIIVAVTAKTVKGEKHVFMYYIRKTGELAWPAYHELEYSSAF